MNCPRCKTPIGPLANPNSIVTCPGCGSRLMTKSAALRSQGGAKPERPAPDPVGAEPKPPSASPVSNPAELPPSATMPPTPAALLGTRLRPAFLVDTARQAAGRRAEPRSEPTSQNVATLDLILAEVRALREGQSDILEALAALGRGQRPPAGAEGTSPGTGSVPRPSFFGDDAAPGLAPIRARRRKSVLLVDDDPQTREAAVAELQHSDVPVRAYDEVNAALAGIAEEKPDVIALEIGVGGEMGGKDFVNMIKATIEWLDIPIILWTREAIAGQREAQEVHGADEVVPKSSGPAALAARVITVFRGA